MLSFSAMFLRAATASFETSQASAITISHRLPMLAALSFWPQPQPENLNEAHRMVTEKFAAITEGALAASERATALTMLIMLGNTAAEDIASGMMSIAVAASEPAHKLALANAERLSKPEA